MTRWIGRWIVAVSVLHTGFGFVVFWPVVTAIGEAGVWNSVGQDPMRAAVAWFILSGFCMAALGFAVDALEQASRPMLLQPAGFALGLFMLAGIVLMPVSGFWLLLPPLVAMIRKRNA